MNGYVYAGHADRDLEYRRLFIQQKREIAKSLVNDEIIEEHKSQPLGQHSDRLERLLLFFRMQPLEGRYAIRVLEPFKAYQIIELSGERNVVPRTISDQVLNSLSDAYHAVFLRRIDDLQRT
jgi:branched-chain amino acid transport system permease protein